MLRVTELCQYSKDNVDNILADLIGFKKEYMAKANLGTFWHSWILRNERDNMPANIVLINHKDYRVKEAIMARDNALAEGKIPLLEKDYNEFLKGFEFLKPTLFEIFPQEAEFEKEVKGDIDGLDLIGHIDCLSNNKVIDLKISEVATDLNKHIWDMRYNLQMFLYMILSGVESADLVFVNPKSLLIKIKTMIKSEIEAECVALLNKAAINLDMINKALIEPIVIRSDYSIPQWALANLNKD